MAGAAKTWETEILKTCRDDTPQVPGISDFQLPAAPPPVSVDCTQNVSRLGMLEHAFTQQVVLLGAGISKVTLAKRQMAIGEETGGYP